MCDLSIIIVNWNAKQYLLDCLTSIYDMNTGKYTFEVIVIDNASSDASVEAIEQIYPQVTLVKETTNLGFGKANNIGIKMATGRYIGLINSDIIVNVDCIKKMIDFMDSNPQIGISGPRILNPDGTLQPSCTHFPSLWNSFSHAAGLSFLFPKVEFFSDYYMNYWSHDHIRNVDTLNGCFLIARKEAFVEVGLFDEAFFIYGEDMDLCKRFNKSGWRVTFYPDAEAIHFGGASSANAPIKFYLEMQKADLQYWYKHHGRLCVMVYKIIILLRHFLRMIARLVQYLCCWPKNDIVLFKLRRSIACIRCILGI